MIINATLINNNFSSKSEPTHKPNIAPIASTASLSTMVDQIKQQCNYWQQTLQNSSL